MVCWRHPAPVFLMKVKCSSKGKKTERKHSVKDSRPLNPWTQQPLTELTAVCGSTTGEFSSGQNVSSHEEEFSWQKPSFHSPLEHWPFPTCSPTGVKNQVIPREAVEESGDLGPFRMFSSVKLDNSVSPTESWLGCCLEGQAWPFGIWTLDSLLTLKQFYS